LLERGLGFSKLVCELVHQIVCKTGSIWLANVARVDRVDKAAGV
jgi:hypothetical protein